METFTRLRNIGRTARATSLCVVQMIDIDISTSLTLAVQFINILARFIREIMCGVADLFSCRQVCFTVLPRPYWLCSVLRHSFSIRWRGATEFGKSIDCRATSLWHLI